VDALAVIGAVTGVASSVAVVTQAVRDRSRLRLDIGVMKAAGQPPTGWIDVHNDAPRATTVREVGLYAKPIPFQRGSGERALNGTGDATFRATDHPVFFEAGEAKRFLISPDIDLFRLHADFPLRAYAVDARGRRTWGGAAPMIRLMVGDDPPLQDEDPEDFKVLFRPLADHPLPWQVEPSWKIWKRKELRKPEAWLRDWQGDS
jgi:hypothetical protein